MSTIERKEYQETKIMRTVSPVRNFRSSSQNLVEFDHNLDNLLEDLQNSVSRPSSSLGTYRETSKAIESKSNSLNRFNNVKASNPVTEYSSDDTYNYTSPDGRKHVTGYKKESYSYKTSGGAPPEKARMQNNINQLDSLLDDLQQVKNAQERESYNNTGADPEFQRNTASSSKRSVQRELHYGNTPRSSSRSRTLERSERESSVTKDIQYSSEGTYGDLRQIRGTSPSSKHSTLSKQTKVSNVHTYPLEVVETTSPDINPEILAHLDPSLHPPGNTKVTTTIKTYTYEIPGSGNFPTNLESSVDTEKYVYSPNQSQTTPSKSFVYKKVENQSSENTVSSYLPPYQKPSPPVGSTTVKETVTTRNYQPGFVPEILPAGSQTYVYNETTTTRNINDNVSRSTLPRDQNPPRQQGTYIIEEHHNVTNRNLNRPYPDDRDYPRNPPRPREEIYIKEIHDKNTTDTVNHSYPDNRDYPHLNNGYPPSDKTVIYRHETHTTNNYGPGDRPRPNRDVESFDPKHPPYSQRPNEPVNIHYRYKSESTTTNNYKAGYPLDDASQPLLPKPFPTDSHPDGPPRKLDELMANIGHEPPNSPYNAGFNAHEQEMEQKKKIETLKRQQEDLDSQKKEPVLKSKNVSGPPVYYPPGHEMFAKKEEGAAWRAEGGYAKASGKYQYEAESKSKSKSSSGAAVIPVCLPLCCGLPCAII